jgi:hypothetical protein
VRCAGGYGRRCRRRRALARLGRRGCTRRRKSRRGRSRRSRSRRSRSWWSGSGLAGHGRARREERPVVRRLRGRRHRQIVDRRLHVAHLGLQRVEAPGQVCHLGAQPVDGLACGRLDFSCRCLQGTGEQVDRCPVAPVERDVDGDVVVGPGPTRALGQGREPLVGRVPLVVEGEIELRRSPNNRTGPGSEG